MSKPATGKGSRDRVAHHRAKAAASGSQRVEVIVPAHDAPLAKAIAGALRSDGPEARRVRETLKPILSPRQAQTGQELVAILRASPLVGADLVVERDRSTGRRLDLD